MPPSQPRMTMARTIKLYKLPAEPATPGLRPMRADDAPAVAALLNRYLARYKLTQHFTAEEVAHWCGSAYRLSSAALHATRCASFVRGPLHGPLEAIPLPPHRWQAAHPRCCLLLPG